MVKKLFMKKRRTGEIAARHRFSGRNARLLPERGKQLKALVAKKPDLTLAELKERLGRLSRLGWQLRPRLLHPAAQRSIFNGRSPSEPHPREPTLRRYSSTSSGLPASGNNRLPRLPRCSPPSITSALTVVPIYTFLPPRTSHIYEAPKGTLTQHRGLPCLW